MTETRPDSRIESRIEPRILKGFRDFLPQTAVVRSAMIEKLAKVFSSFGFSPIDTPALEYAEILLGKGGAETDKQMFRFRDQGERDVALRFDLTVPLARFAAMHINELGTPFKRYHIAPVWRAEKPQRGRFREFMQCDFDTIGTRSLLADTEILTIIHSAFAALKLDVNIRINNRQILNGFLESLGAREKSAYVLRAIDKLEKLGRDVVKAELCEQAGLSDTGAERVFEFLSLSENSSGNEQLLDKLRQFLSTNDTALKGIDDLNSILSALPARASATIDLSIARGLDYYTGVVFETQLKALPDIGSVCSGGRYDNLASLYTKKELPGVGASVGLDRLLAALEELKLLGNGAMAATLVTITDPGTESSVGSLCQELRNFGLNVEMYLEIAKLGNQFKYADRRGIKYAVITNSEYFTNGKYILKNLNSGDQTEPITASEIAEKIKHAQ